MNYAVVCYMYVYVVYYTYATLLAMPCYMLFYSVLYYAMLCNAMLCYAMLCYAMLCYAMLCYAMLCYAMLCYAMLCYAMLCYAMLCLKIIQPMNFYHLTVISLEYFSVHFHDYLTYLPSQLCSISHLSVTLQSLMQFMSFGI